MVSILILVLLVFCDFFAPSSSKSYITFWVPQSSLELHQLSSFPNNPQDSKLKMQAQQTNKKKSMKVNNNMTPQQSGKALHCT